MLIKNYGHLWQRAFIDWGDNRTKGHLKGYRGKRVVDFREQVGVYVLYNAFPAPIYVGQAGTGKANLFNRLRQHHRDHLKKRWSYFSWFGLQDIDKSGNLLSLSKNSQLIQVKQRSLLNEFEAILMTILEPTLNKQGPRWFTEKVAEYEQYIDESIRPLSGIELINKLDDLEDLIRSIKKK
jgi:hypothetical protein